MSKLAKRLMPLEQGSYCWGREMQMRRWKRQERTGGFAWTG